MSDELKSCPFCGGTEFFTEQKGHATGLYCSKCGKWQKWLNKDEIRVIEHNKSAEKEMTNADKIRNMSDEELAKIIMCPYDTAGEPDNIMPCVKDGEIQEFVSPEICNKCMVNWLQSEVKESEE